MEVHCGSCPAKYAVPDDKVRGRKVRIKCKHCSAPIVVDGTALGSPSTAPRGISAPPAAAKRASVEPAAPISAAPSATAPRKAEPAPRPSHPLPETASQAAKPSALRLSGAAASSAAATAPEKAVDSASSWREPAQQSTPESRPNPHAGWREPAAAAPRTLKGTMLGIPAPATIPGRPQKATLLGLDAAVPPRAEPAVAPAPVFAETARPARSVKRTMLGIPAPAGELPLRPEAPKPAPAPPKIETPVAPAAEPARFDASAEPEWTVAVTDDDHQEMTTAQVIDAYATGKIGDSTFIWAEGMDDWKTPFDIPLIAAELAARGFAAGLGGADDDDKTVIADAPSESQPSGVWREPGSWRPEAGEGESDVSFDDVTVSMDSNRAAELLRAAGAMDERPQRPDPIEALMDDTIHDDVTRAVDSTPFFAESRPLSDSMSVARPEAEPDRGVDWDDEPTMAMEGPPPPSGEQKPTGARNEDSVLFSLDALAQSESGSKSRPELAEDEILIPPSAQPSAPLPAPPEPARGVPAAFAATIPAGGFPDIPPRPVDTDAARALAPPPEQRSAVHQAVPGPLQSSAPGTRSSRAWLWLLLLLMLAAAALALAFYFRQPAELFELLNLPS